MSTTSTPYSEKNSPLKIPLPVSDIINAETARLDAKEQTYQNVQFNKQRLLQLNQNYQDRTSFFNSILFILVLTFSLVVMMLYLNKSFPDYDTLFTFLNVVILIIGLSYSMYLYVVFMNRNPMNFDEIVYGNPSSNNANQNVNQIATDTPQSFNLVGSTVCSGPSCCDETANIRWNADKNICVKDGFTNMSFSGVVEGLETTPPTQPTSSGYLINKEIYLDGSGQNVITSNGAKSFTLSMLHTSTTQFTSSDYINFITTPPSNLSGTVVTAGPNGPAGQTINGKGILITDSTTSKTTYYYPSMYPPGLQPGDKFISDGGALIDVLDQNTFYYKIKNDSNPLLTFTSSDSFNYISIIEQVVNNTVLHNFGNDKAYIVTVGNDGKNGNKVHGQAIAVKLSALNTPQLFYYNGNSTVPNTNEERNQIVENFEDSESGVFINQYKAKTQSQISQNGFDDFHPNQSELPFVHFEQFGKLITL
jgi:hypothetical protein